MLQGFFLFFRLQLFLGEKLNFFEFLGLTFILVGGFILGAEKIERGIFKPRITIKLVCIILLFTGIYFVNK